MATRSDGEGAESSGAAAEFQRAAQERGHGFFAEYWFFLKTNKKWWLLPIIVTILLIGLLVVVGQSALAPFIYTLF